MPEKNTHAAQTKIQVPTTRLLQRFWLHIITLALLQRLLVVIERQVIVHVRSRGGGAQAIQLAGAFSRAVHMGCVPSSGANRYSRKTSEAFIAAAAIPRPLPTQVIALPFVQHYLDVYDTIEFTQLGCRLCLTLHIPNSIVPAFGAARFEFDDVYVEFGRRYDIKLATMKFHQEIGAHHAGSTMKANPQGWVIGPPTVDGTVSVTGFDSQSYWGSFPSFWACGVLCPTASYLVGPVVSLFLSSMQTSSHPTSTKTRKDNATETKPHQGPPTFSKTNHGRGLLGYVWKVATLGETPKKLTSMTWESQKIIHSNVPWEKDMLLPRKVSLKPHLNAWMSHKVSI